MYQQTATYKAANMILNYSILKTNQRAVSMQGNNFNEAILYGPPTEVLRYWFMMIIELYE